MPKLTKNLLYAFIILLLVSFFFSFIIELTQIKENLVSLNDLAKKVKNEEVSEIIVRGNELEIFLKNGERLKAQKEPEVSVLETLKGYGIEPNLLEKIKLEVKNEGGLKYWASILIPSLLPVIIIAFIFWWIFRQARAGMNQTFSFSKANLKVFNQFKNEKVTFKDIAGLKEAKEELVEIVDFLKNPKKYLEIGARIPRGVILIGPPGTGKTLLARAVANEAGVPFFHISASEFVEMFVGVGAARVRDLFQTAKKAGRSIIFIDEIDAVGRERGAGLGGGHDEREQTLNQILVEMDGFEREDTVIVMAATNRPDILDPALLRPGRFDRRIILDIPDLNDREEILKIHARGKPLAPEVNLREVAIRTPGFSGADLANLMNEAAILAARENKKVISQKHLYEAIEKVILGPERKSRVISPKEKEIIAYHEAGHALVAAAVKNADPVQKVSIVSRGLAGGYTLKLPTEERRLRTKSQFLAELAVAFGGYAAEFEVFKEITTGSYNDLKEATALAHRIVTQYGMNETLGPRTFGRHQELIFLGREITTEKDYSDKIAALIDEEVNKLITKTSEIAKKIVSKYRKVLDAVAQVLLEKETLEKEEFYKIIESFQIKPIEIK